LGGFTSRMLLKLGSRTSVLAKIQSLSVGIALKEKFRDLQVDYFFRESAGDLNLHDPLWKISGQGMFTKELQEDLLSQKIDAIVHSWKDLDLNEREQTNIISVLPRADERDFLFFKKGSIQGKPNILKILTSSPRREYNLTSFIRNFFPISLSSLPLDFISIRGNVQTRFRKFIESDADGYIVASAAIQRLLNSHHLDKDIPELQEIRKNLQDMIKECEFMLLPVSQNPCAPAQGALCVEIRKSDTNLAEMFGKLSDSISKETSLLERSLLKKYGGGCHQKIGINVMRRDFGNLTFIKGITESGEKLDQILFSEVPPSRYRNDSVWPPNANKLLKRRIPIFVQIPKDRDLYVTKSISLPNDWIAEDHIIWTSGTNTWQELAKRNHWVHGTSDGLGESEEPNIDYLIGRKLNFIKLSHDESQNQKMETLKTYEVVFPEIAQGFAAEKIKAAFWSSSSEFFYYINIFPEWKNIEHFCGPGITSRKLKEYLGENKKIIICPSFQYWKDHYIDTKS